MRLRVADQRYSRYAPVPLAIDVPESLKIYFEERAADYPAVVVERTALRAYPYGPLAAHMLGYVGKINDAELVAQEGQTAKPYTLNDEIGKSGVEQTYEPWLRGTPGLRRIEVDAEGNPIRVISERPPRAGDDLVMSIDVDLQALAEQKVQQGLADARARPNRDGSRNAGTRGAAVVMDPNNGQILAMASYPSFDPNVFVDGVSDEEWAFLNDPANGTPLNNWAVQGHVGAGIDLQAVRRLRRPHGRSHVPRHGVRRPGRLRDPRVHRGQVLPHERRWLGLRPGHDQPGHHHLVGRVLLQRGRPVLAPAGPLRRRRRHAEPAAPVGHRRPHRRRPHGRVGRPGADPGLEARLLHQARLRHRLAHGRQRQHGHRPGRRAGHPAAAGHRLRHVRQRGHPLHPAGRAAGRGLPDRPDQPAVRPAGRPAGGPAARGARAAARRAWWACPAAAPR